MAVHVLFPAKGIISYGQIISSRALLNTGNVDVSYLEIPKTIAGRVFATPGLKRSQRSYFVFRNTSTSTQLRKVLIF